MLALNSNIVIQKEAPKVAPVEKEKSVEPFVKQDVPVEEEKPTEKVEPSKEEPAEVASEPVEEEKKERQLYARQWHELYVETTKRIYQKYNVSEDEIKEVLQGENGLLHCLRGWL